MRVGYALPESENQLARRRDDVVTCTCGRRVERQSRRQVYCSEACRQRAHRERMAAHAFSEAGRYVPSPTVTNSHKNPNKSNVLHEPKCGSSPRILAPKKVIEAELFAGRKWASVASPDGVAVLVAGLRPSGLRRRGGGSCL